MKVINGIPISDGIAIGRARLIKSHSLKINKLKIDQTEIEQELERFENNIQLVVAELDDLIKNFSQNQEHTDILSTQKLILQDPEFFKKVKGQIKENLHSLEHSVSNYYNEVKDIFHKMENEFYAQRLSDYEDVVNRLLRKSMGIQDHNFEEINENNICIMKNATPSEVTKLYARKIKGLLTEEGSRNSHAGIIARSLRLPMISGIQSITSEVIDDDEVIFDGKSGKVFLNPNQKTKNVYLKRYQTELSEYKDLEKLINLAAKTNDGKKIGLMSNIEIPEELDSVLKYKSEGIGLFRTEFLFIDKEQLPTEDLQTEIYQKIAFAVAPQPLTIRTIDVGGDKISSIINVAKEDNPNLGCRGIRISLENIDLFKQQLKAIIRANVKGNVRIMFPMISDVSEVITTKKILKECLVELQNSGFKPNENIQIGAMIEVPSAVITAEAIAAECDFLSIGTNDLTQYLLAVDRDNQAVARYYKPCHPSVLRSIKMTVESAHRFGIPVALCGEMAADERFIKLLIGLGVDELSVSPGLLLSTKREILNTDYQQAADLAEKAISARYCSEIAKILGLEDF
jgi:phosphotransferase system enzyme I (PtsI)